MGGRPLDNGEAAFFLDGLVASWPGHFPAVLGQAWPFSCLASPLSTKIWSAAADSPRSLFRRLPSTPRPPTSDPPRFVTRLARVKRASLDQNCSTKIDGFRVVNVNGTFCSSKPSKNVKHSSKNKGGVYAALLGAQNTSNLGRGKLASFASHSRRFFVAKKCRIHHTFEKCRMHLTFVPNAKVPHTPHLNIEPPRNLINVCSGTPREFPNVEVRCMSASRLKPSLPHVPPRLPVSSRAACSLRPLRTFH